MAREISDRFFPDTNFGPSVELDPGETEDVIVGPISFVNSPPVMSSCLPSESSPRYLIITGTPFHEEPGPDGLLVEDGILDQPYPGLPLPFDFSPLETVEGVDRAFIRDREAIIERGDSIIVVHRASPGLDDGVLESLIGLLATAADQQFPTA